MIVIDSSVALAWIRPSEPYGPEAKRLYQEQLDGVVQMAAPFTLWHEVLFVLYERDRSADAQLRRAIEMLVRPRIRVVQPSGRLLNTAADCVYHHGGKFFDATFIAAAIMRRCRLVTLDRGQIAKANRAESGLAVWLPDYLQP